MAKIVIVDDDELICTIVARTLQPSGHTVVPVRDGDDALDTLWEHGPDLIILDCALPGKTGLTILREIRQSAMFGTLPVLILTARRSEWHAKVAMEAGASDYVRKPFDADELIAKVDHLLTMSAPATADGAILDGAQIDSLRAALGIRQADGLLKQMERDVAERSADIAALLRAGDIAAARKQAHALKGAADCIGALDLARHCHAIERDDVTDASALTASATATIAAIAHARAQEMTSSA